MDLLIPVGLLLLVLGLFSVLLSHTSWVQQHARWLTNIGFYLVIGIAIGSLLTLICYQLGESLANR
ncbi:hypothetical protein [Paenibacillus koleovorans]|uniref:hypothetical protein n=1 Tax=Paenibacillus koleovorans TaxID=121608 RepID=UPI000FDCC098|nr:hypothetical protein [Paenibacillus koleovorans]